MKAFRNHEGLRCRSRCFPYRAVEAPKRREAQPAAATMGREIRNLSAMLGVLWVMSLPDTQRLPFDSMMFHDLYAGGSAPGAMSGCACANLKAQSFGRRRCARHKIQGQGLGGGRGGGGTFETPAAE